MHSLEPNPPDKKGDGGVLFFVFVGRKRPWTTLQGVDAPSGHVFEAHAYPSGEYAMGESWDEAKESLRKLVDQEIDASGLSPAEWYQNKLNELSHEDRKTLTEAAFTRVRRANRDADSHGRLIEEVIEEAEPCLGKN